MQSRIRVFELAKELRVDSKNILEVLQTLNVDVKNHMSTIDQETAQKVTEKIKRSPAKKAESGAAETAKAARPATAKPVREANPAKASLLADFFGAGTKPPQRVEDMKRELRPIIDRSSAERADKARIAAQGERAASQSDRVSTVRRTPTTGLNAEQSRTFAERSAGRTEPVAPVAERSAVREQPAVQPERGSASVEAVDADVAYTRMRTAQEAEQPVETAATPSAAADRSEMAEPQTDEVGMDSLDQERATAQLSRPVPSGPVAGPSTFSPSGPRGASGLPRPASAPSALSAIGLPTRPVPGATPADRPGIEGGPRRPAAPASGQSGIGLPTPPGVGGSRPSGLGAPGMPRPAGSSGPGIGSRPGAPRPGGYADRGPRPSGFGAVGGRPRPGGALNIPKVDPKVAEQAKPVDGKPRIGQGGDRKKGDAFTKRETSASRPSEEKLFGRRRPSFKGSVVDRRSLKPITIEGSMTVKDLSHEMGVTAGEVIKKLLTGFGIMATINQELDIDTCVLVGGEFGVEVTVKEVQNVLAAYDVVVDPDEDPGLMLPRHPVVTIMGHVDHGKTSLLDAIRSAKVAAGEAGGITQHIGAYEVELNGKKITFLDTPGHEAFTAMRARGANVTDIAVLVVAADDSVMPQTIESINHARAAGVPILVAINKIDRPQANPDKVKQDLTAHGLVAEEWGGETIMVLVSAKEQLNLDGLLENILLVAEVAELKANPHKEARATILEAQLDKARGPVATVLVQAGTLLPGDSFVAGSSWGRVRAMFDHRGRKLKSAGPSTPVQLLGFQSVPAAGDVFRVAPDEKTARSIAEKRQAVAQSQRQSTKAMSLDDFMSKVAEGEVKDLNLIIKADVQGSVEALRGQLEKLRNEEVQVKIVHGGVGAITETDVMLASASGAILIGFNVRPDDRASRAANDQGIDLRTYNVIYNIVDDVKAALTGMLAPKIEESILGRAEVREIFKVPKVGMAAGCRIVSGKVSRNAKYRLIRDGVVVWDGEINALRRFKDEVKEVAEGFECGITLERFQDFKPGDLLEAYEMKEVQVG